MKTIAVILVVATLSSAGCSRNPSESTDPAPKKDDAGPKNAGPGRTAPKETESARETRNLRGQWTGTAEFQGNRINLTPDLDVENDRITRSFDLRPNGKSFDLVLVSFKESKKETFTWVFDLNPLARPAAINLRNPDGANKGKSFPGIYLREGDTLKFCFNPTGRERPTQFTTAIDSEAMLFVLTRRK